MTRLHISSISDYDYVLHLSEHKLTRFQYQKTEIALRKHVLIRNLLIKAHAIASDTNDEEGYDDDEDEEEADQPLTFGRTTSSKVTVVDTDKSKEENWFETCFDQLDQDNVDSVIVDYSSSDEDDEEMEDGTVPRWIQDVQDRYYLSHSLSSADIEDEDEDEDDADAILKLASRESSCDYFLRNDKECSVGTFDPFGNDDVVQSSNSFINKYSWIEWRHDPIAL
ncbi:hypothetical protein BGW37DRAFT_491475 [Umbelopsis sp. PMI_123]|nr:hypothetical protein BGW37DRAFT_491475 [Umbelopsis sp. PMI_123]